MRIEDGIKLDFCDVLIRPKRSEAPSRKSIQLIRTYEGLVSGRRIQCVPIIAANMLTTGTLRMAQALNKESMLTCLHKFYDNIELLDAYEACQLASSFVTVGIRDEDFEKLRVLNTRIPLDLVCVDVANGYTKFFVDYVQKVRAMLPKTLLMVGNVATPEMVQELLLVGGADIVKIGIGPGSVCTTRLKTGVGYPQLSAIIECADAAHGLGGLICADGGCTNPADIAKAFGGGADFVMLGGMLAGTNECAGLLPDGDAEFFGMSSEQAQMVCYGGVKSYCAPEGKSVVIKRKGPVSSVLRDICGGLRSACAYVGAERLKDLSKCTTFVRVNRTHNRTFDD
ncbi:MAG: hypothetical protein AMXMBFR16_11020 [Candidatus Uhrbacteria bacterium]